MLSKSTSCTVKYIDDASQARSIRLKKSPTEIDISDRPTPLEFYEYTGFVLNTENNQSQEDLNNLMVIYNSDQLYFIKNTNQMQIQHFLQQQCTVM